MTLPQPTPNQFLPRRFDDIEERLRRLERRAPGGLNAESLAFTSQLYQDDTVLGVDTGSPMAAGGFILVDYVFGITATPSINSEISVTVPAPGILTPLIFTQPVVGSAAILRGGTGVTHPVEVHGVFAPSGVITEHYLNLPAAFLLDIGDIVYVQSIYVAA
ncbi:MAG: hypothetical protein ABL864_14040 [Terricaulis sp.]